ncbi:hypothetical protein SDC9_27474 [bioreactor metagenome]|uniref:Uncharacterized protein n=1 Tax=bioreactor metagenome TaxID=1076179 RepID=A0A644UR66_9ZZZZ|nr:hypothetical protein [Negativicutes bacterium]
MLIWAAFIAVILIVLLIAVRFRVRNTDNQLNLVTAKLDRYLHARKPSVKAESELLQRLYALINVSMSNANDVYVYRFVDLLKLAYGNGMIRSNEYQRLGSIIIMAIRNKQPDIAAIVIGAFRPLIRNIAIQDLALAIEQLTLIAVLATRLKYSFLLAKVVEAVFEAAGRKECSHDSKAMLAVLRSTRIIGTFALRRHEYELFRELLVRLKKLVTGSGNSIPEVEWLFVMWLHQLAKSGDDAALESVANLALELFDSQAISINGAIIIITESSKAAGTASLNQSNKVSPLILQFILELASKSRDPALWRKAVNVIGQVSTLAVSRRGIAEAFDVFLPMLETGRRLLADELKFGVFTDDYRKNRLFVIIRECILVAELNARQDMTKSTGEVITEIYEQWVRLPQSAAINKSLKRYCQMLLLYWQNTRQRQARRGMPDNKRLLEPMLISDEDKKRLGL